MSRPVVNIQSGSNKGSSTPLPAVFETPIRLDIVHDVFTAVNKNKRQAYAVARNAGEQTSAESWGTGRAVARIPRVGGSGTYRSGQGAFGNMCRGGRMFAPTKTWRRWHVKVNLNEKRYATASAIAASSVASLVLARGHRVEHIPEVPLVVGNEFESLSKTKDAVAALKALGAHEDVVKVLNSKKLRAGKGKMRNRRHTQRRGPLVVYNEDNGVVKALRNVPGVETCNVEALNILQLAPGSHLGRFVIWTEGAFNKLDKVWSAEGKNGYTLPHNIIANPDITGTINSSEIQSVLRAKKNAFTKRTRSQKKNPLTNRNVLLRLNPYAKAFSEQKLGQAKVNNTKKKASAQTLELLHDN